MGQAKKMHDDHVLSSNGVLFVVHDSSKTCYIFYGNSTKTLSYVSFGLKPSARTKIANFSQTSNTRARYRAQKKQPPERICRQVGAEAGTDCRSRGKPRNGVAAGTKEAVFNELSGRKGKNNRKNACEWKKVAIFAVPKGTKPESGRSSVRLEYTSGGRVVAGSNPVTPTQRKTCQSTN